MDSLGSPMIIVARLPISWTSWRYLRFLWQLGKICACIVSKDLQ